MSFQVFNDLRLNELQASNISSNQINSNKVVINTTDSSTLPLVVGSNSDSVSARFDIAGPGKSITFGNDPDSTRGKIIALGTDKNGIGIQTATVNSNYMGISALPETGFYVNSNTARLFNVFKNGSTVITDRYDTNPATSSDSIALRVDSVTKGFLPPVMTGAQAVAITSPTEGMFLYVTSTSGVFTTKGWWGYNGTTWIKLG